MSQITSTGPRPDPTLPPTPLGPIHFNHARLLLDMARDDEGDTTAERYHLAAAQVHATLALTAAIVQSDNGPTGRGGGKAWLEAVTRS